MLPINNLLPTATGQTQIINNKINNMLSFLKKDKQPKDVKMLRSDLLDFIKSQLKKAEGEGADIKGMHLYINCDAQDKFIYDSAVYINNTEQFKEEVQRIADDFDIIHLRSFPSLTLSTHTLSPTFSALKDSHSKFQVKDLHKVLFHGRNHLFLKEEEEKRVN